MAKLAVNIDHVATLRQARRGDEPDPVTAAALAELGGCDGIIVHLREDRRHIQDRDLEILRKTITTSLNLEMAPAAEIVAIALRIKPDVCTLVPEKREELTTEGGLDVVGHYRLVEDVVAKLHGGGISVSLFVDPTAEQIDAAQAVKADCVEIHTGIYSRARVKADIDRETASIERCAHHASGVGLEVRVGHGLNYHNIGRLTSISEIAEYSIGHSIMARAVFVGMERAVREMVSLVKNIR
ncbi:MAG: pyridoxine 5'-phosphate synthase [Deltaproteobacteria bacterium]|nr:pyridoxine 5'-phosphate synthase [Deltaproteobacteria bacterium]